VTAEQLLQRARSALAMPTLYWLGKGGRSAGTPTPGHGDIVDWRDHRDDPKAAEHLAKAQAAGLDPETVPPMPASDCTGFVWWVLGEARDERNTDWIHRTTRQGGGPFERFDPKRPLRTAPGALLVYPKPPDGFVNLYGETANHGHIGIVTAVDGADRAARVIHCSARNFLLPPAPGEPRNAIRETGPELFVDHAKLDKLHATLAIWLEGVPR